MLTMLEYREQQERGAVKAFFRRLRGEGVQVRVEQAMDTGFVRICAELNNGVPDWKRIARFNQEPTMRVLAPEGVELPREHGLVRFKPAMFKRRLLENLALEALVQANGSPGDRRVALLGSEAELSAYIPRLAPLVGELRIISNRPYALSDTANWLREERGMEVTVTNNPNAKGFELVVAPGGLWTALRVDENAVVISPDKPAGRCRLWVEDARCALPVGLESAWRPCYDKTEFVAAFYELAGLRKLSRLMPECGLANGESVSSAYISKLI